MKLALDIDQTLSLTRYEYYKILSKKLGNPEELSPWDLMKKYGSVRSVPFWVNKPQFNQIYSQIEDNKSMYLKTETVKDSVKYVNKINNELIEIGAYISARYTDVYDETVEWLSNNGFPKAQVILRDREYENEYKWKVSVLHKLKDEILGIVDDSPKLVDAASGIYTGKIFLIENSYSGSSDADYILCKNWKDTYDEVKSSISIG